MDEQYLDLDAFYMNSATGSVARGKEWLNDFLDEQKNDPTLSWDNWNQQALIQVVFSEDDQWVEV